MDPHDVRTHMRRLARGDGRYAYEAFVFVSDVTGQTVEWLREGRIEPNDPSGPRPGEAPPAPGSAPPGAEPRPDSPEEAPRHISGKELLAGFVLLARERWGLLADQVLSSWGVRGSEDVGEIVFLMVEDPHLPWRKRPCDTRADFAGGPDFTKVFRAWDP